MSETGSTAGKGGARKSAAAQAETNGQARTIKFGKKKDLELTLPSVLPGTIVFDLEAMDSGDNPDGGMTAMIRMLRSVLGPEQLEAVRAKVASDGIAVDKVDDSLDVLLGDIFEHYQTEAGESEASATS